MKRRHNMPFGAEMPGRRKRPFSPLGARRAQGGVCLSDAVKSRRVMPLDRRDEGWFELITDAARPGSPIQFSNQ